MSCSCKAILLRWGILKKNPIFNNRSRVLSITFGIGRPERKEDVGNWVLSNFALPQQELESLIDQAATEVVAFAQDDA